MSGISFTDIIPGEILCIIFEFIGYGPIRALLRMVCKSFFNQISRELRFTSYTNQQKSIIAEILQSNRKLIRCILPKCGKKVIINTVAIQSRKPIIVFTKSPDKWVDDTLFHFTKSCKVVKFSDLVASGYNASQIKSLGINVVLSSEYSNLTEKDVGYFSYFVFYGIKSHNIKKLCDKGQIIRIDNNLNCINTNRKIHFIKHYVVKGIRIHPVYINIESAVLLKSYWDHCDLKSKMQKLHRSKTYSSEIVQKYFKSVEFSIEDVIECIKPHFFGEYTSTDLQVDRISVFYKGFTQDFYFMPTMDRFMQLIFDNISLCHAPIIYIMYPGINYYKYFYKQYKTFVNIRNLRNIL